LTRALEHIAMQMVRSSLVRCLTITFERCDINWCLSARFPGAFEFTAITTRKVSITIKATLLRKPDFQNRPVLVIGGASLILKNAKNNSG